MRGGIGRAGRLGREAELEVLLHGEPRKDLPALRHVSQPEPGARVRRQPGDVRAVEADGAGARRQEPGDAFEERRLAHAVAAEDGGDGAGRRFERDVAQRMAAAVVLVERVDGEHFSVAVHRPR